MTIALRDAVGLPREVGLLVRGVADGGAAAAAGIRQGDVLVRAGNLELRSVAALDDASASRKLRLTILRGTAELMLDLAFAEAGGFGLGPGSGRAETIGRAGTGRARRLICGRSRDAAVRHATVGQTSGAG